MNNLQQPQPEPKPDRPKLTKKEIKDLKAKKEAIVKGGKIVTK